MAAREIPVRVWLTIDATLDNVAANERVGGDEEVATHRSITLSLLEDPGLPGRSEQEDSLRLEDDAIAYW